MRGLGHIGGARERSFLPEDYVQRQNESRTNLLAVTLFAVVTLGVVGAFLVTSRQWHDVKRRQEAINVRYAQAAQDIEQLKQLEGRKDSLLQKAELTTALIERVPRSFLLAELINRMPEDVTLLELEVKSQRVIPAAPAADPAAKKGAKGDKSSRTTRSGKDAGAGGAEKAAVAAPRYLTNVVLVGVTKTHNSVAQYVAELQRCPLLAEVELKFSEKAVIQEQDLNRFRIEARLKPDADARRVTPLAGARLIRNAMGDGASMGDRPQANAPVSAQEGDR